MRLTPREAQVLPLLPLPGKDIAMLLCIKRQSVQSLKRRLFSKLGARNSVGGLVLALRAKLVELGDVRISEEE